MAKSDEANDRRAIQESAKRLRESTEQNPRARPMTQEQAERITRQHIIDHDRKVQQK